LGTVIVTVVIFHLHIHVCAFGRGLLYTAIHGNQNKHKKNQTDIKYEGSTLNMSTLAKSTTQNDRKNLQATAMDQTETLSQSHYSTSSTASNGNRRQQNSSKKNSQLLPLTVWNHDALSGSHT